MEKIEAAAIKFRDVVWSVPAPGRHHDVIAYILRERPWYKRVVVYNERVPGLFLLAHQGFQVVG